MTDNPILQANLEALATVNPGLTEKLGEIARDAAKLPDGLQLETGKKGLPTLKASDRKGEFYLHSPYDPVREAEQWASKQVQPFQRSDTAVVIGFGLGYLIEALLQHDLPERVIVVIPSQAEFLFSLSQRDFSAFIGGDRVEFVVGLNAARSAEAVAVRLQKRQIYGWRPLIHPAMARLYFEFVQAFTPVLSSSLTALQTTKRTKLNKSDLFMRNALANFPLLALSPGVEQLKGRWLQRPVALVAAGPSLDKQLPLLIEWADRVLIIAVGQAWRSLRQVGIEPHMVVTVDPNEANLRHFESMKSAGAVLVADAGCHPRIPREFAGPLVFNHSRPDGELLFSSLCGKRGVLETGGSVANTALSLACELGASPILLLGQDLAFSGGRTHAQGNAFMRDFGDKVSTKRNLRPVEGYYGDTVYTNAQMDTYRHWFEKAIERIESQRVINCTEGGARIRGVEQMRFSDALQLCDGADPSAFEQLFDVHLPAGDTLDVLRKVEDLRRQLAHVGDKAANVSVAASRLNDLMDDPKRYRRVAREIKQAGRALIKRKEACWVLLGAFLARESFAVKARAESSDEHDDLTPVAERYYQAIAEACRRADQALQESIAALQDSELSMRYARFWDGSSRPALSVRNQA